MGYIHVYYTVTLHTKAKRKPGLLILTAFLLVDGIFHKFCMIFKEKNKNALY